MGVSSTFTFVVLGFVDRALSTVKETPAQQGNRLCELVWWSVRLQRTLRQLGDIENLPPTESAHTLCLLTRVHVLLGCFDDMVFFLSRIWDGRPDEEAYHLGHQELRLIENVLQALACYCSAVAVPELIVSQWHTLGRLINMSPSSSPSLRQLPCRPSDIAFRIFDYIPSPVAVIADMHSKPKRDATLTGLLLIKYLIRRHVPENALAVYREMWR